MHTSTVTEDEVDVEATGSDGWVLIGTLLMGAEYGLYAGRQTIFIAHSRRLRKVEKV